MDSQVMSTLDARFLLKADIRLYDNVMGHWCDIYR